MRPPDNGREEPLDGSPTERLVRDPEGGQAGSEPAGERVVVERHDRDVVRDGAPGFLQRLVGAEGEPVVEADECAGFRVRGEEVAGGCPSFGRVPLVAQRPGRGLQAGLAQHLEDAGEPLDPGDGAGRDVRGARSGADEVDLPVPGVEEQLRRRPTGPGLVGDDRGEERAAVGNRVEQHRGDPVEPGGQGPVPGEHRGQHDPVDLPVGHRVEQVLLGGGVTFGLADEEEVALLPRGVDGPLDHVAGQLRGRHAVRDEAEGPGGPFAETERDDVRTVAELVGRGANAPLDRLGDPELGSSAREDEGRRRRGHAGSARDVRERHSLLHHCGPLVLRAVPARTRPERDVRRAARRLPPATIVRDADVISGA